MNSWAIVAVPESGDDAWKRSSEKIPHMTLLFLGEQDDPELARNISQQLEHTIKTSLMAFTAQVDYRGVLGDKDADVLFFEKDQLKQIEAFRNLLLQDTTIRQAYDSTEQYEGWTPHLTLGYPETPAKKPKNEWDDREIRHVHFDKIALWVGDFEGPTYDIDYRPGFAKEVMAEREPYGYDDYAVPHSATPTLVRTPARGGRGRSFMHPVLDVLDETLLHALEASGSELSHMDDGGLLTDRHIRERYVRQTQEQLARDLKHSVGGRPDETRHILYDFTTLPNNDWVLSTIDTVAHTGTAETRVRPESDELGAIVGYTVISDDVPQSDLPHVIKHVGVKGMKWGVRRKPSELARGAASSVSSAVDSARVRFGSKNPAKIEARVSARDARKERREAGRANKLNNKEFDRANMLARPVTADASSASASRSRTKKHGTDALSNQELKKVVERMNLEQQYANLQANEKAATARGAGKRYAADIMKDVGSNLAQEAIKYAATEGFKYAAGRAQSASQNRSSSRVRQEQPRGPLGLPAGRRAIGR